MIKKIFLSLVLCVGVVGTVAAPVGAADGDACGEGGVYIDGVCCNDYTETSTFGLVCNDNGDGIYSLLTMIISILTYGIGILATAGIMWQGWRYMTAGDDPGVVKDAKLRIWQIIIGLIVYALIWAFVNWLIPGGVL